MEIEFKNSFPFLDLLANRESNGHFGNSLYRKLSLKDKYLQAQTHHHLSKKRSVMHALVHRAISLSETILRLNQVM